MQQAPTGTMGYHSLQLPILPFDDLRPQDRVVCFNLSSSTPNQVLWGKYLLCQTISATRYKRVGIQVCVTDPDGASTMRLVLFNYSVVEDCLLGLDFDEIVPPGSFLVLKNPCWMSNSEESFMLQCYNPAEVELLSWKRVENKFPDLEWRGPIKMMVIQDEKRNFWGNFEDDDAAFEKLKGLGNKGFVDKRFSDAIRFYDMALDYCNENLEDEAMIRSNKSAALLALGCFNSALKSVELALEVEPSHEKYNYRKAKALIGLGKYEEARNFLQDKFEQFPSLNKSDGCKKLLENVNFLESRKNLGPTESQLLSLHQQNLEDEDKIPEFTGPLTVIPEIEGKGRGLIATEDIRPGQLLISTKVFGLYVCTMFTPNLANSPDFTFFAQEQLAGKIANKLAFDPELGPAFYNLTTKEGHLSPGDWRLGQVDMRRILEIVKTNSFATGSLEIVENKEAGKEDWIQQTEYTGVWILPALFNHSCSEHNCYFNVCGEVLTLRAVAEIKKGEELTICYQKPFICYEERHSYFTSHGYVCNCKLCKLEASESISVRNKRAKILKSFAELGPNCASGEINNALKGVKKLVALRKDNVPLNFPLLTPEVLRLGQILVQKDRIGDAISVLSRVFEVADSSICWHIHAKNAATNLMSCHAIRGDEEQTKFWMANTKRLLIKFNGNLEPMRFNSEVMIVELLKSKFGIDFFQDE